VERRTLGTTRKFNALKVSKPEIADEVNDHMEFVTEEEVVVLKI
jgi:hypothetical protein